MHKNIKVTLKGDTSYSYLLPSLFTYLKLLNPILNPKSISSRLSKILYTLESEHFFLSFNYILFQIRFSIDSLSFIYFIQILFLHSFFFFNLSLFVFSIFLYLFLITIFFKYPTAIFLKSPNDNIFKFFLMIFF